MLADIDHRPPLHDLQKAYGQKWVAHSVLIQSIIIRAKGDSHSTQEETVYVSWVQSAGWT